MKPRIWSNLFGWIDRCEYDRVRAERATRWDILHLNAQKDWGIGYRAIREADKQFPDYMPAQRRARARAQYAARRAQEQGS